MVKTPDVKKTKKHLFVFELSVQTGCVRWLRLADSWWKHERPKHGPSDTSLESSGVTVVVSSQATWSICMSGFPHTSSSYHACWTILAKAACISRHETGGKKDAWRSLVGWNTRLHGTTINEHKPGPVHSPLWLHATLPVVNSKKQLWATAN